MSGANHREVPSARPPARAASGSRLRLVGGGVLTIVGVLGWIGVMGLSPTVGHAGVLGLAALVVGLGAAGRWPRAALWACFAAGVFGYLAWTWGYDTVAFPYVDVIRPWGMDKGPYPVFRPMLGTLLCLGFVPLVRAARGWRRWAWAALAAASLGISLQFWTARQWYEMDMVAETDAYPDMPSFLPRPGWVGTGESPMVVDGRIAWVHWTEYSFVAPAVEALPFVARREEVLARLAWGLAADIEQHNSGPDGGGVSVRSTARTIAWSTAIASSWAQLYYQVGTLPVLVALLGFSVAAPESVRVGRALGWLTRLGVWGVPLINLFLLAVGLVGGLPEVTTALGEASAAVFGILLAVSAVDFAGHRLEMGAS